jgi:hypothetical protein
MESKPAPPEPSFDPLNLDAAYEGKVDLNLEADYEGIELRILASLGLTQEQVKTLSLGMTYGDMLGLTDRYRAEGSALRVSDGRLGVWADDCHAMLANVIKGS